MYATSMLTTLYIIIQISQLVAEWYVTYTDSCNLIAVH